MFKGCDELTIEMICNLLWHIAYRHFVLHCINAIRTQKLGVVATKQ
jgi:hypothetical protein